MDSERDRKSRAIEILSRSRVKLAPTTDVICTWKPCADNNLATMRHENVS